MFEECLKNPKYYKKSSYLLPGVERSRKRRREQDEQRREQRRLKKGEEVS